MALRVSASPQNQTRLEAILTGAELTLANVQAHTSAGLVIKNSAGTTVATLGDGPGTGLALVGDMSAASVLSVSASGIIQRRAATQDAVVLLGRAGGTGSFAVTLTPATLAASHTITVPAVTSTMATLAAQTFVGAQQFPAGTAGAPSVAVGGATKGLYDAGSGNLGIATSGIDYTRFGSSGILIQSRQSIAGLNTAAMANSAFTLHGADGADAAMSPVSYGNGSGAVVRFTGFATQGTGATPAATAAGDLVRLSMRTHTGSAFATADANRIDIIAGSTHSGSNREGRIEFYTCPSGSVIATLALTLTSAQAAVFASGITVGSTTLLTTSVALTNGAGAAAGTLLNAPAAGNPTKWLPVNDNGTTRYVPSW